MSIEFTRVATPADHARLVDFLCADEWPFHTRRTMSADDVGAMEFSTAEVSSWWIHEGDDAIGLVRALDLGDIGIGAPLFDVRVATAHRGRGIGTTATRWLTDHLFATYSDLHRLEANTSEHNVAMQHVLARCGYLLEGRLRDAWLVDTGERADALLYGILRRDRESTPV